jgi:FkbM family methyltransferase
MLKSLLPAGVERFANWKSRFEAIGFSPLAAARAAGSGQLKRAYQQSRIEHLPVPVRKRLHCVLDVGANEGQWSGALLDIAAPRRLEVFEPNPAALIALNARVKGHRGVRVHQLALGAAPGELVLNVTRHSDFSSLLPPAASASRYYAPHAMEVDEKVTVRVDTLDRVAQDMPVIDLLKLDVQGFERHVLEGGADALRRTRALLIEANFVSHYESDDSFASLSEALVRLGFELWDLSPPFRADNGRALWCDAVFVQPHLLESND